MNNRSRELLIQGLSQLAGITDDSVTDKLIAYMDMVIEKNKVMNLTAITEPEEFVIKHYIDSLAVCRSKAFADAKTVVDVGTGGGFPGIPLAAAFPDKEFILMDSLNKRIRFIEEASAACGIINVKCVHSRAEEMGKSKAHRERYDLCVSRAVARLSVLSEYCLPLVKPGGYFVPYKTDKEDPADGSKALKILGGKLEHIEEFPKLDDILAELQFDHRLLFIKKISPCPAKYPRKAGTPAKEPL